MKKRIRSYMEYMDRMLENNDSGMSYEELNIQHEKQMTCFMHERLMHLLATLIFVVLALFVFAVAVIHFSPVMLVLFIITLILLIPYIMHYYLLENSVQYLYKQHDRLQQKLHPGAFAMKDEEEKK